VALHACRLVCAQFAPSYSDYVLYSDGGPADNVKRKKYRAQKGVGGTWNIVGGDRKAFLIQDRCQMIEFFQAQWAY
jgi:hypothetical protein